MMPFVRSAAIAGLVAAVAACAPGLPAPTMIGETAKGRVLTNDKGMTLYVFDRDAPGRSNCNGQCAVNWPPLMSDNSRMPTGDYSFISRDDGKRQWAYKGRPLYLWAKDAKPGETTGDGMLQGAWHVATP